MASRILFSIIILVHGLIHILGFIKAFQLREINLLTKEISRAIGVLWLCVGLALILMLVFYLLDKSFWPFLGLISVIASQILIIAYWQDAKYGSIANILLLIVSLLAIFQTSFRDKYETDVSNGLDRTKGAQTAIITEEDLEHLPPQVIKYLKYVGVVGKPRVKNARIFLSGKMRSKEQDWFSFNAEQYNFYDDYERLFFMNARVKGLPTAGYHRFKNGQASMEIKVFSVFSVADISGKELTKAETVTIFNDMCLMVPSTLIHPEIKWEVIDEGSVIAHFTIKNHKISAVLEFNEKGELIQFTSQDRFDINTMKQYPFSTPIGNYSMFGNYRLPSYGEAIWHYPDGKFTYGIFNIDNVEYNYP